MIDDGLIHGAQHAVGKRRRSGNVKKVAPCDARGIFSHYFRPRFYSATVRAMIW
jgi:hypothetical protein